MALAPAGGGAVDDEFVFVSFGGAGFGGADGGEDGPEIGEFIEFPAGAFALGFLPIDAKRLGGLGDLDDFSTGVPGVFVALDAVPGGLGTWDGGLAKLGIGETDGFLEGGEFLDGVLFFAGEVSDWFHVIVGVAVAVVWLGR